jgi:phosphoribosylamine-glycine ligase
MHIDRLVDKPTRKLSSRSTQSGERHLAAKGYPQKDTRPGLVFNADCDQRQACLVSYGSVKYSTQSCMSTIAYRTYKRTVYRRDASIIPRVP